MHQFFNSQLNIEFLFLFSPSKLLLLSRADPPLHYENPAHLSQILPTTSKKSSHSVAPFVPHLIVDFLDPLGLLRRTELLSEFCGVDDFRHLPRSMRDEQSDPLFGMSCDEGQMLQSGAYPVTRGVPFDIDDDIIIMPNILNRLVNSAIVVHSYIMT